MTPFKLHDIAHLRTYGKTRFPLGGGIHCTIIVTGENTLSLTLTGDYGVKITCDCKSHMLETSFNSLVKAIVSINAN